jgi:hypothetical protein
MHVNHCRRRRRRRSIRHSAIVARPLQHRVCTSAFLLPLFGALSRRACVEAEEARAHAAHFARARLRVSVRRRRWLAPAQRRLRLLRQAAPRTHLKRLCSSPACRDPCSPVGNRQALGTRIRLSRAAA